MHNKLCFCTLTLDAVHPESEIEDSLINLTWNVPSSVISVSLFMISAYVSCTCLCEPNTQNARVFGKSGIVCPLCDDLMMQPVFTSNDLITLPSFPNSPPANLSGIISVNFRSPLSSADTVGGGMQAVREGHFAVSMSSSSCFGEWLWALISS